MILELNDHTRHILDLASQLNIRLLPKWIDRKQNKVADRLSKIWADFHLETTSPWTTLLASVRFGDLPLTCDSLPHLFRRRTIHEISYTFVAATPKKGRPDLVAETVSATIRFLGRRRFREHLSTVVRRAAQLLTQTVLAVPNFAAKKKKKKLPHQCKKKKKKKNVDDKPQDEQ
jgi:hypothetical protein